MITSAEYVGVFRAHWAKLLLALVIGAGLGLVASQLTLTQYSASRLLVVRAQEGQGLSDLSQGSSLATDQATAIAYLGTQSATIHAALDGIGVPRDSRSSINVATEVPSGTTYVSVVATAATERLAVDTAQAITTTLEQLSPAVASTLAGNTRALVVDDVTSTTQQFGAIPSRGLPGWVLPGALAAALPLVYYLFLVLRNVLNGTVGESMDLGAVLPFPVLGSVDLPRGKNMEVVRPSEAHHNVLVRAGLLDDSGGHKMVAVTKVEGDVDPRLAVGLGQALGDLRRSVMIVDADLAAPSLPFADGAPSPAGLAAMLGGAAQTVGMRRWLDSGADVLPTTPDSASTRMLRSEHAEQAFELLRALSGTVLLHTAPALPGPDAAAVAEFADEVLLFATPRTPVDDVIRAAQQFRMGTVSGVVLLTDRRVRGGLLWARSER